MRTSAVIVWKPILVDLVADEQRAHRGEGSSGPALARSRYAKKDLADWAEFCGVSVRHPGPYPLAARWALRGAVVAAEGVFIRPYSARIFEAGFNSLADIDSLEVVCGCAAAAGLDVSSFRDRIQQPGTQQALEDNSRELRSRGGFGSPTMFVGDDMYFGNDRMPLVELALTRRAERPFIAPWAHGQQ